MKNLLKTVTFIFVFAVSGVLFQISCSNSNVQTNSTSLQDKIIFSKSTSSGFSIWICNYDGSGLNQIPIVLPPNYEFSIGSELADVKLSPNGQKIFFKAHNSNTTGIYLHELFSCNNDGSNVQLVTPSSSAEQLNFNIN
jgi:Tol biopolymer transport system component